MNNISTAEILIKHKKKIINAAVILFAFIVANNIYGIYARKIDNLKLETENEMKKNEVLMMISASENKLNSYKQFINAKDLNGVLNTISNLAKDFSVAIISVRPRGEVDYSSYTRLGYDLTVIAKDYHSLGQFISKLESSPDIFMVYSLSMQPIEQMDESKEKSQPADTKKKLKAELVVNTVWMKNLQK